MADPRLNVVLGLTDNASRQFGNIRQNFEKHRRAIDVGMTAMGAAIVGSLALSVKAFATAGDEVQKMALRTGFSTEALSELRFAAELSGTSLKSFETATRRMSQSIVQAEDGLTTATRAFERMNIDFRDLKGLAPEDQFFIIAGAMADMADETQKVATATELFGRAGTQLLPLLAGGAQGIQDMREEARKLGIVFSQEAANKAAEFNDALTRVKGAAQGLMFTIAEVLIPTLTSVVTKVSAAVSAFKDWSQEHPLLTKLVLASSAAIGGLFVPKVDDPSILKPASYSTRPLTSPLGR